MPRDEESFNTDFRLKITYEIVFPISYFFCVRGSGGGERAFAGENLKNITGRTQFSTTKNKKKFTIRVGRGGEMAHWREMEGT